MSLWVTAVNRFPFSSQVWANAVIVPFGVSSFLPVRSGRLAARARPRRGVQLYQALQVPVPLRQAELASLTVEASLMSAEVFA